MFSLNLKKELFHDVFDFSGYLLACVVLVGRANKRQARAVKLRGDWGGINARSRALRVAKTAMLRRLVYICKVVLDFALCKMCSEGFTNYLISCIQSSIILESQFNINRHFAFSRVDARESGNNGDIWQCYLIKSVFLNPILLNSFRRQWST